MELLTSGQPIYKFIYLEILSGKSTEEEEGATTKKTKEVETVDKITPKVIRLLTQTVNDLADDDGWAFLGDVGSLIEKKQPNFDSRNYGFEKLTPLIKSIGSFEIEHRENPKSKNKFLCCF